MKMVPLIIALTDNFKVTSSCTFTGTLKKNINIDPGKSAIYIKLDDFSTEADIVVDDTDNGRVNFLIPKWKNLNVNGNIVTKYYSTNYKIPGNPIIQRSNGLCYVDEDKIPDIYFYMEAVNKYDLKTALKDVSGEINIKNGHIVSGYILAPSGKINCSASASIGTTIHYSYENIPFKDDGTGEKFYSNSSSQERNGGILIGAAICDNANLDNQVYVGYVNPNPVDENGNKVSNYLPRLQYYQAY